MDENELKLTKYNFEKVFPNAPFQFNTILSKIGHIDKTTKNPNGKTHIRYLTIHDIKATMEKRIRTNNSPNRKSITRWQHFIENDIQNFLDNESKRLENET